MARILIPESLSGNAIAAIRSLVRQGDRCEAAWSEFKNKSRYVAEYHKITSSAVDDLKYVQDILSLCKQKKYDVLIPFGNTSYFAFAKYRDSLLGNAKFMVTDFATFKIAHDKFRTAKFCEKIGLKTPRVFTEYSHNDVFSLSKELRYPVVIKAKSGTGVHQGLRYANNGEELLRYYEEIASFSSDTGAFNFEDPLIQEFIPGFIHDACTLTCNGKVVNVLTQRREMMYPIYGGVGAVNVTTHNSEVLRLARTLLEALNWHGPAQIEFKYDERDRTYKLIELNPKLWGTLDLSIKVGMNFPKMIRDILLGIKVEIDKPYPPGVRYKFLFPRAILAYLQIVKEFGLSSAFDKASYAKTIHGFCVSDPKFELFRVAGTLKTILKNAAVSPNSNIPKKYINRFK